MRSTPWRSQNLANATEVAGGRRHGAGGGADHRLGDEGHHRLGAETLDLGLQRVGGAAAVGFRALVVALVPVGVAGLDVADVEEQRRELRPPPFVAAGGERAEGVAVIALLAGDQPAALGLALFHPVLPRQLDRRLRRLRATGDEIDPVQPRRRVLDQKVRQRLRRPRSEEAGVREGEIVELRLDRRGYVRIAMSEARHRRPARPVQIPLARLVHQVTAAPGHRDRRLDPGVAGKDVGHGGLPFPAAERNGVLGRNVLQTLTPCARLAQ